MSLRRLPDEVWQEVFLEDILGDVELYDLALVSRRFSRLTRPSLYSTIKVCLLWGGNVEELNEKYKPTPRYECLMRTLIEHPEMERFVRHIFMNSYHLTIGNKLPPMEEMFQKGNDLLKHLPSLRSIHLSEMPLTHSSRSIFNNNLHHLHNISTHYCFGSLIHAAITAMSLRKIDELQLRLLSFGRDEERENPSLEEQVLETSPLRKLDITTWDWKVVESNLFRMPQALRTLALSFGFRADFYPERLVRTLNPLLSTLVNLHLQAYPAAVGPFSSDLSVGDFRSFVCLKSLWISDALCFRLPPNDWLGERCGFYNQLPLTIETLEIDFYQFVFHKYNGDGQTLVPEHNYEWVLELAQNKPAKLPELRTVSLIENGRYPQPKCSHGGAEEWIYPACVKEAFEMAAIDLKVIVRPVKEVCCEPSVRLEVPHLHLQTPEPDESVDGICDDLTDSSNDESF